MGTGPLADAKSSILSHLTDQLLAAGYLNKPLDADAWDELEAVKLEKCLSNMLAKLNSSQNDLSGLMDKYRSLASDYDRLAQSASRSSQTLASSEHEREQAKSKAEAAAKELAAEQARHTQAKEEIQKARLALQAVKTNAQYESKRRENEMASIVSRWQKVSAASSSSSFQHVATIAINATEKIGRNNDLAARSNGRTTPSEVALLEDSLNQAHEAKEHLQEENVHLREVIGDVLNEVRSTLAAINVEMPSLEDELSDSIVHSTTPHLHLPPNDLTAYLSRLFLLLRDATQLALQASDEIVAAELEQQESASSERINELEESLKAMQEDLDAARLEARQHQDELETLKSSRDSRQNQLAAKVKEEQRALAKQRADLEMAQSRLAASQEKLAREKDSLEVERRQLLDEVASQKRIAQKRAAEDTPSEPASSSKRSKLAEVSAEGSSMKSEVVSQPARTSSRTKRPSTTAATLQHILASGADTPPIKAVSLASKSHNTQSVPKSKTDTLVKESKPRRETPDRSTRKQAAVQGADASEQVSAPSSAALAAKDRIQRAVEAARQRSSRSASDNIRQR